MNGIAGVWNLDARPIERRVLATMSARLAHRGRDGERLYLSGPAGLACQHSWVTPEEQGEHLPLVGASGAVLVMDGRIDNRHDLVTRLALDATVSDARCVLAAYEAWGEGFAERLNGDFALAILDAGRGRLILARDALGVRPLYYFHSAGLFAFGSEIKALLAHPDIPAQPDDEGVADFMLVGARPLDRQDLTCFRGISSVVPAHVVVATRQALTSRRYWNFDTRQRLRLKTTEEYVEAFHERFVEAVRRRTRSAFPVAFSVSGGLDSSSIFCQSETLRRSGAFPAPSITGLSYISDRTDTDEQHFLRDIEGKFDVHFDRFTIETRTGLVAGAQEQVVGHRSTVCGLHVGRHARAAPAGRGHRGALDAVGTLGRSDALLERVSDRSVPPRRMAFDLAPHTRVRPLLRRRGDGATPAPVARRCRAVPRAAPARDAAQVASHAAVRANPAEVVVCACRSSPAALRHRYKLATLDGPFHSAHARAIYIEARSKYQVQCMEWNSKVGARYGLEVAFPFLDRDLIAFLMAIPGEMHAHHGVPRALLRRVDARHPARFDPHAHVEVGLQRVCQPGGQRRRRRDPSNVEPELPRRAFRLPRCRKDSHPSSPALPDC